MAGPLGVVLCGGSSRRMGADKASLVGPGGRTMAQVVSAALRAAGVVEVLSVGARPGVPTGADHALDDDRPGSGPLAAIATAARHRPGRRLLVAACDLPQLDPTGLAELLARPAGDRDVVVPELAGRPQWSCVVVGPGAAAALEGPVVAGERALGPGLALAGRVVTVPVEDGQGWSDADRPEDLPAGWTGPPGPAVRRDRSPPG